MNLNPQVIRQEIANLLLLYPELTDDEALRADMIEGETEAFVFLSRIVRLIGETVALSEGTKAYVKELCERGKRLDHRAEAFRALAFKIMQTADLKKAELPEATISVKNGTPKVIVINETELPESCVRIRREPDKTAIKDMLINGQTVPGATLSNAEPSLSIRVR